MVNVALPMVTVPVREFPVVFEAAVQAMEPLPVPLVADVMVTQDDDVEAVHAHTVVKVTLPLSPAPFAITLAGFRL